ncbi:MAG TPA: hypothetical protein DD490_24390 [Acidobacteria bacterium]|nr:hypothetical protein [Acidobacteriota bacterium]
MSEFTKVLSEMFPEHAVGLKVVKRRSLSELYGALPATRPFPGKDEVRELAGRDLGETLRAS